MSPREAPARELRTARALVHPLRLLLLFEYGLAVTSPSKVGRTLDIPVNVVSYHTRVLIDAGLLELVRVERRRGAHEHFYRRTGPADIEDAGWSGLPVAVRRQLRRRTLEIIWAEATESLPEGGLDDPRTHVSRSLLRLDDRGLTELAALLRQTLDAAAEIERASRSRSSGGSLAEVAILQFTPSAPGRV